MLLQLLSACLCLHAVLGAAPCVDNSVAQGVVVGGNQLFNNKRQAVRLIGVDRSGSEFMCFANNFFDGPVDVSSLREIVKWGVNVIRVPLNEDCWLNINSPSPGHGGQPYIDQIVQFVQRINQVGCAVILDLHWTGPGTKQARQQEPMPDRDHSVDFWKSVANTFKNNPSVIFDIHNEPYPDGGAWNSQAAWTCLKNGGTCAGVQFQAAGMQELVNAIRSTGARNVLMVAGLAWSNGLQQWLQYMPSDTLNPPQIAASWHTYNFNYCNNKNCWEQSIRPVLNRVPVIVGEIGENTCDGSYVNPLMEWLDSVDLSYLGWTWNTWDCKQGPALITSYNGTPTPFGAAFRARSMANYNKTCH